MSDSATTDTSVAADPERFTPFQEWDALRNEPGYCWYCGDDLDDGPNLQWTEAQDHRLTVDGRKAYKKMSDVMETRDEAGFAVSLVMGFSRNALAHLECFALQHCERTPAPPWDLSDRA